MAVCSSPGFLRASHSSLYQRTRFRTIESVSAAQARAITIDSLSHADFADFVERKLNKKEATGKPAASFRVILSLEKLF